MKITSTYYLKIVIYFTLFFKIKIREQQSVPFVPFVPCIDLATFQGYPIMYLDSQKINIKQ